MDFNELLALDFTDASKILKEKQYNIEQVKYLNSPPGSPKIVRIRQTSSNGVEVLISYHYDWLKEQSINPL